MLLSFGFHFSPTRRVVHGLLIEVKRMHEPPSDSLEYCACIVNWDAIDKVEQRVSTDTPLILSWYPPVIHDQPVQLLTGLLCGLWLHVGRFGDVPGTWDVCSKVVSFKHPYLPLKENLAMRSNYNIPFSIIRGHHFF